MIRVREVRAVVERARTEKRRVRNYIIAFRILVLSGSY